VIGPAADRVTDPSDSVGPVRAPFPAPPFGTCTGMWAVIAVPLAVLLFPLALLRVELALLPHRRKERRPRVRTT
jgi:hypothetical protein